MVTDFQALRTDRADTGVYSKIATHSLDELPAGDTLVRVAYSSLNYKDALALSGHPGVVRQFPHTAGIDAAGTTVPDGRPVIVHGYELGMSVWGGFGEYIRIPASWVVERPRQLDARAAMVYGTAGFTAAMCVDALQRHGVEVGSSIVVTGASGGVGSLAVAMASRVGYRVVACTGKHAVVPIREWLEGLGAVEVVARDVVIGDDSRPLERGTWAGAVDTTGGAILAGVLRKIGWGGAVAACGLTAAPDLPTTVYPFILRGVSLLGVDSAQVPLARRQAVWNRIADELRLPGVEAATAEIDLVDVPTSAGTLLDGTHSGRTVVRIRSQNGRA